MRITFLKGNVSILKELLHKQKKWPRSSLDGNTVITLAASISSCGEMVLGKKLQPLLSVNQNPLRWVFFFITQSRILKFQKLSSDTRSEEFLEEDVQLVRRLTKIPRDKVDEVILETYTFKYFRTARRDEITASNDPETKSASASSKKCAV